MAIALGILLAAPSLTTGLCADDWLQSLVARGLHPFAGLPESRLDLFSFAGHDPRTIAPLIDAGMFPWWTDPTVKLAFWRPLSSLTHLLDWSLWPGSPWLMHLHSLLWFGLALAAVAAFYRRFLGPVATAGLATVLYAVDDAHGPAVGWIANRNAMVAVAAALPVVLLHDRWRRDGWRAGAWLGPLLLGVALLAGESSLAVVAYLVAYALCLDRARWRARVVSLAPHLAVVVVWRVVYRGLGYGTAASGVYLDPGSDPLAFVAALPSRAAYLIASQLALPWSDFATMWPFVSARAATVALTLAALTVALAVLLFLPLCRRDPVARFFAVGALLSVVPIASTFPADRLLWFVGVGAMGLVARWLATAPRAPWAAAVSALLVFLHLIVAPPLLALRSRSMNTVGRPLRRANDSLPASAALAGRVVILVNPPADLFAGYLVLLRAADGDPLPPLHWLATGTSAVELTRTDERTLRVRPDGGFIPFISEHMLRDPRRPILRGSEIRMRALTIEVTEVGPDGRPAEVMAHFDRSLDASSLYWARWEGGRYVAFSPPPVGARVVLPATSFLEAVFGK